jgi:hypothetical protein
VKDSIPQSMPALRAAESRADESRRQPDDAAIRILLSKPARGANETGDFCFFHASLLASNRFFLVFVGSGRLINQLTLTFSEKFKEPFVEKLARSRDHADVTDFGAEKAPRSAGRSLPIEPGDGRSAQQRLHQG